MAIATKSIKHAKRKTNRAEYRVRDTVRTVRGEGVIKFVFPSGRNGKTAYSVNFANKRLSVIFHENELAPGSGRPQHM
jgi:predicted transcriptional regulator